MIFKKKQDAVVQQTAAGEAKPAAKGGKAAAFFRKNWKWMVPVVCVQNMYNIVNRGDDALVDLLAQQGIAYVPFFPLGGFTPLQSSGLKTVADSLGATPMQVALAWLLQRSPNILLIPGTSSVAHLRQNLAAGELRLPPEALETLNSLMD